MNIRFTNALDALPARVQRFPQAWGRLGARARWLGGALAVAVILASAWYFLGGQSGAGRSPAMPVIVAKAARKDV
ncbi:MAG: hypothetical protein KGM97_04440, partial [Alphaproteobacteria bacterium]|nr:hypothetical protein [Alphaproteobacteria bacterium]